MFFWFNVGIEAAWIDNLGCLDLTASLVEVK